MTVHDAIPKERGLSVSFTFLCQNPAPAGFLLSESVTRMNNCPRRYTKRTRLIGQFHLFMSKPRSGGVLTIRKAESGLSVSYRYLTTLGFCSVGIVESCT